MHKERFAHVVEVAKEIQREKLPFDLHVFWCTVYPSTPDCHTVGCIIGYVMQTAYAQKEGLTMGVFSIPSFLAAFPDGSGKELVATEAISAYLEIPFFHALKLFIHQPERSIEEVVKDLESYQVNQTVWLTDEEEKELNAEYTD